MVATVAMFGIFGISSCEKDDAPPPMENEEEVISHITLTFTPIDDPNMQIEARAVDPDGAGVEDLIVLDTIYLSRETEYKLTFQIENALEDPAVDIGEEILEEAVDHQLFFGFTPDAFSTPTGDGNIDVGTDPVSYLDSDLNGLPLGLETQWNTSQVEIVNGFFQVRLQHLPEIKSATSNATDGDTDFDLTFQLMIE